MGNDKNHGGSWLDRWLSQPIAQRTAKRYGWELEDLQKQFRKGFKDQEQKEKFIDRRAAWFDRLRNAMRNFSISKDQLAQYGLNFAECKRFYFQAV